MSQKLTIKIAAIKFTQATEEKLKLSGIDILDDFNTFNVKEINQLLGESFEEVLPTLRRYHLPRDLSNQSVSNETIDILEHMSISTVKDLLDYDRKTLFDTFHDDPILLKEINDVLELYGIDPLRKTAVIIDGIEVEEEVPSSEIDLGRRIRKEVPTVRKGYGSRTYSHLKIRLASPDEIRQWSYGEVKNHETINYRTSKPEKDGLFCERIFGPTKNYQCDCGKKTTSNKGQKCPKCGIEITDSKVRRERMGHIELEAPVVHIWYLKNSPSKLAILLGIKAKQLEEVVYHAAYIVLDPGTTSLQKKQILTEQEYGMKLEEYGNRFTALTGAEAVKELLMELDLDAEVQKLRRKIKTSSRQKREGYIRRLEIVEAFNNSDNKPEWMVLDVIPVLPPDLRPMLALDGGRFATTDLNDLYRRILNRNKRLRTQIEKKAPYLIIKNEKRMLQEAVDSLIDNARRGKKMAQERNRPLKSLSDLLSGKQGRFRQNLLGKRVDYSGRSVIVVGPDLEMHQCGLPREMAITLFKPFVIRQLKLEYGYNRKESATKKYDRMDDEVWNALEDVVKEHPVLLNRAPTLHRLGIQAFEPKLIDGKAIRLHPLVTPAFNADFDGDQMAVHVPLSNEAIAEARLLMLASNNILNPKDGKPVVTPSQDMVLGNYYLTLDFAKNQEFKNKTEEEIAEYRHKHRNEGSFYANFSEVQKAYENEYIDLHTRIVIDPKSIDKVFTKEQKNMYLVTTYGKLIFNDALPSSFTYLATSGDENLEGSTPERFFVPKGVNPIEYIEELPLSEKTDHRVLGKIILKIFKELPISETSKILDKIKALGFKYSTVAGLTVSAFDINVYSRKQEILAETQRQIDEINALCYEYGASTDEERRNNVNKAWEQTTKYIANDAVNDYDVDNNIYMIFDSGARGNLSQFNQLLGMRGSMRNPKGDIIEIPVKASLREGLSVAEFFISTHGSRKGSTDTALKTAESGYLTRRLVDVSQDVIVVEEDCGTSKHNLVTEIKQSSKEGESDNKPIVNLYNRIVGRYTAKTILYPETSDILISSNELITEDIADEIVNAGIKEVAIRSTLTCDSENGVCAKCYGRNLSTNLKVEVGEAVGVIAAQSIGEPGTQLTMRTFHTGGVASASDITQGLPRIQELFEIRVPKGKAVISEVHGKVNKIERKRNGLATAIIKNADGKEYKYAIPAQSKLLVSKNQAVKPGDKITEGSLHPRELLRVLSASSAQNYILEEVQKVYNGQGVGISDKHIEIIVRQMMQRVFIVIEGDTDLISGTEVSLTKFKRENKKAFKEGKTPAVGRPILLGITRAALRSESFLSAASFQETTKILTDAAVRSQIDELYGLKENVIIGGLIPAGTGILQDSSFSYDKPEEKLEEYDEYFD